MKTLLDEAFAPITSAIGFIEAPLDEVAEYVAAWRRGLNDGFGQTHAVRGGLADLLTELDPLPAERHGGLRELFVSAGSHWTAHFGHMWPWHDLLSPTSHICRVLARRGVVVRSASMPDKDRDMRTRQPYVVSMVMVSDAPTDWLNLLRTIELAWDGRRLAFHQEGEVQPWEETSRYRALRARDRFDTDLLERYCRELGIDVFDTGFYGPEGRVIDLRPGGRTIPHRSLRTVQAELGIVPGAAASVRG